MDQFNSIRKSLLPAHLRRRTVAVGARYCLLLLPVWSPSSPFAVQSSACIDPVPQAPSWYHHTLQSHRNRRPLKVSPHQFFVVQRAKEFRRKRARRISISVLPKTRGNWAGHLEGKECDRTTR